MISERDDKKIKKSNTKLMIISVLVLTILTLNVSYSAFFDVKVQPNLYSFKAGTLNVTVNGSSDTSWQKELKPVNASSLANTVPQSGYVTLTIQNDGDIDALYSVTLADDTLPEGANDSDRLGSQYIYVGVYDTTSSSWVKFGTGEQAKDYAQLSTLKNGDNKYPILNATIDKKGTSAVTQKTYRIYVWLSSNTPVSEIGKLVYLKVNVHSTPVAGQQ